MRAQPTNGLRVFLCVVRYFLGLLEVLLGKPGTVHSPGFKFLITLGVPPDLRECSSFRRVSKTSAGGGMSAPSLQSRGLRLPCYQAEGVSFTGSGECLILFVSSPSFILLVTHLEAKSDHLHFASSGRRGGHTAHWCGNIAPPAATGAEPGAPVLSVWCNRTIQIHIGCGPCLRLVDLAEVVHCYSISAAICGMFYRYHGRTLQIFGSLVLLDFRYHFYV